MLTCYKARTNSVNHIQYKNNVIGWEIENNLEMVLEMDIYNSHPEKSDPWYKKNHPLVNKGLAFWVNKTYICIGYKRGDVFRPIFNYRRENQLYSVRRDIVKYAKILSSNARHSLYKKEIMKMHNKKIPVEIVEHIANYTWDIMLLLK
jgi:hypothetical protein